MLPASAAAAYELVQASQALQAVQALQHLDPNAAAASVTASFEAEIEPLTQDPTLLLTTMAQQPQLTEAIHLQLPPLEAHQGLPYAYKEGLQASPDLARTIQVCNNFQSSFPFFFSIYFLSPPIRRNLVKNFDYKAET